MPVWKLSIQAVLSLGVRPGAVGRAARAACSRASRSRSARAVGPSEQRGRPREHGAGEHVRVVNELTLCGEIAEVQARAVVLEQRLDEETAGSARRLSPALVAVDQLVSVEQRVCGEARRDRVRRTSAVREEPRLNVEVIAPAESGLRGAVCDEPFQPPAAWTRAVSSSRAAHSRAYADATRAIAFAFHSGWNSKSRTKVDGRELDRLRQQPAPESRPEGQVPGKRTVEGVVRVVSAPVPRLAPGPHPIHRFARLGHCVNSTDCPVRRDVARESVRRVDFDIALDRRRLHLACGGREESSDLGAVALVVRRLPLASFSATVDSRGLGSRRGRPPRPRRTPRAAPSAASNRPRRSRRASRPRSRIGCAP